MPRARVIGMPCCQGSRPWSLLGLASYLVLLGRPTHSSPAPGLRLAGRVARFEFRYIQLVEFAARLFSWCASIVRSTSLYKWLLLAPFRPMYVLNWLVAPSSSN
ncbi:hypothetical protein F4860DRAFT_4961 [Xylaria cubensis]|nr:hypothetical protein F4860DRAFT_4961 [Xylaria cubensis]